MKVDESRFSCVKSLTKSILIFISNRYSHLYSHLVQLRVEGFEFITECKLACVTDVN